jgi:hypothetical protein
MRFILFQAGDFSVNILSSISRPKYKRDRKNVYRLCGLISCFCGALKLKTFGRFAVFSPVVVFGCQTAIKAVKGKTARTAKKPCICFLFIYITLIRNGKFFFVSG